MVVAGRVGEPGHISVWPSDYPFVVGAEFVVSKEANAAGTELIDDTVYVIDNEVEERERRGYVIWLRVDQNVAASRQVEPENGVVVAGGLERSLEAELLLVEVLSLPHFAYGEAEYRSRVLEHDNLQTVPLDGASTVMAFSLANVPPIGRSVVGEILQILIESGVGGST